MQVAASTRSLWDLSFAAACGQLQDLGFDKAEIWISDDFQQLTVAEVATNVDTVVATFREASRLSPVAIFLDQEVSVEDFGKIVQFASQLRVAQMTIAASPLGTPFNSEIDRLRERNHLCIEEGIRLSILTRTGLLTEDPHTAVELCQSVKGLGITLDPSYYTCTPKGAVDYDVVFPKVTHVHLRDTSPTEIQVPGGLGEIDYNRIIASLQKERYDRTLCVDLLPNTMQGEERLLEMRKLRLLLESLL
ncbi:MAG: sugar phosphate isomerase/epimerase [Planctomycetaceae bacterium]